MGIDSDWARLVAEGQDDPALSRDRQLAALLLHSRQQSIALQQVQEKLEEAADQVAALATAVEKIRDQMKTDAELLAAVRDTATVARVTAWGVKWLSGIVVGLAGLWWAWRTFRDGGGPPDIGVGP